MPTEDATIAWATALASVVQKGTAIGLVGEVGAGKTTFTAALVRALGAYDVATSPTFALIQHYVGGRLRVMHVDLYRLRSAAELEATGYWDDAEHADVLLVEWADQVAALPPNHLFIALSHADAPNLSTSQSVGSESSERTAVVTASGEAHDVLERWQAAYAQATQATAPNTAAR